jgi:hypothetical protein
MVPLGVTLNFWFVLPPSLVFAVITKSSSVRDSAWVGVQVTVAPLREAPVGAVVNANETVPPEGSVAVTV